MSDSLKRGLPRSTRANLVLPLLLVAACANAPAPILPASMPDNPYLKLGGLRARPKASGLLVMGEVRASRSRARPVNAHLHVTGLLADGTPAASSDTTWDTLPVQGSRLASFSALLRTEHPELIKNVSVELRLQPDRRD